MMNSDSLSSKSFFLRRMSVTARVLGLFAIAMLVAACATPPAVPRTAGGPLELQWPAPPLKPRITWQRSIADYRDLGISKSFWERVSGFFFGADLRRIVKPYGIHVDAKERLFIVDVGAAVVHFMDMKKLRYTVISGENGAKFQTPVGVTEDDAGNLYITDSSAGTVYRYDIGAGLLTRFASLDPGRPTGIAFNKTNKLLYVVDTTSHQVVVLDRKGAERFRIGSRGDAPGTFNFPTDIWVDRNDKIYVTDALNSRIQIFSSAGKFLSMFGAYGDALGEFQKPKGVAVDSDGNIYVADALLDAIQIFDSTGRLLLVVGAQGAGPGEFWMPSGLFIDDKDQIYIADSYNMRVQVFRYLKAAGATPKQPTLPAGAPVR
jgi:sugar lactone lactonase YvrE